MFKELLIKKTIILFGINDEIKKITPYFDYFNFVSSPSEVKYIAKVEFLNHNSVVIRITKEKHIESKLIEKQCAFSQKLMSLGINTPKRHKVNGKYVGVIKYKNHILNVTIEEYVNENLKKLNKKLTYDVGVLMGFMHKISEIHKLKINSTGYVFNLLGSNDVIGYDKLIELNEKYQLDNHRIQDIKNKYDLYLNSLKEKLKSLEKYAVQGDLYFDNLTYVDDELWVYDYNIACDEYLIVDMVIQGLLLAYEADYEEDLSVEEYFNVFYQGYKTQRQLSKLELEIFNLIWPMANALWFTKIHIKENSLESLLKDNKMEQAKKNIELICNKLN